MKSDDIVNHFERQQKSVMTIQEIVSNCYPTDRQDKDLKRITQRRTARYHGQNAEAATLDKLVEIHGWLKNWMQQTDNGDVFLKDRKAKRMSRQVGEVLENLKLTGAFIVEYKKQFDGIGHSNPEIIVEDRSSAPTP